ncbi:MAG: ornithine cyclodeaminase family protein [Gemmatimonadetes bacterium]|nr:ornithine cyclodeaminase family protein [Gemmatimonadota bacterium]
MPEATPLRIVPEAELRAAVMQEMAIAAVEEAFAALARGEARLPGVINLDIPEAQGEIHVKGAHLRGAPFYAFKLATGFYGNRLRGLPTGAGLFLVGDAATGLPVALLLDNGYLTELRTGAAGAVAASRLARAELHKVAVVGAGVQARFQLRALAAVRALPRVEIWSRDPARAAACAAEMERELGVEAVAAPTVEAAVRDADLVVTVTPSRAPLVRAEWLAAGAHVTAVGSDGPEKQELDVGVLARADRVFVDHLEQCLRLGELHHAVEAGVLSKADVAGELGEVIIGRVPGRTAEEQITVCDLTGVGVQDAAIAAAAARALGLEPVVA